MTIVFVGLATLIAWRYAMNTKAPRLGPEENTSELDLLTDSRASEADGGRRSDVDPLPQQDVGDPRIDALTRNHPNARVSWAIAREALLKADGVLASEFYGLEHHRDHPIDLKVQTGLVPIGMNPRTKLWEFYHLRSAHDPRAGTEPARLAIPVHRSDGSIEISGEVGIVFVLLPGGTFSMGTRQARPTGADRYRYVARAKRRVETVAPFFLARHELTQGQWLRLSSRENPSAYSAGREVLQNPVTMRHPVEQVDWEMSTALMARNGLQLPDEREWEYGCRARTRTPWSCGKIAADLDGYANVLDASARESAPNWTGEFAAFDDGHAIHAPVGTYKSNAFGLYDTHGNVWEWCRNLFSASSRTRVLRGGSFSSEEEFARSSYRNAAPPTFRDTNVGMRPARVLER